MRVVLQQEAVMLEQLQVGVCSIAQKDLLASSIAATRDVSVLFIWGFSSLLSL